jgi:hypothetical protein
MSVTDGELSDLGLSYAMNSTIGPKKWAKTGGEILRPGGLLLRTAV